MVTAVSKTPPALGSSTLGTGGPSLGASRPAAGLTATRVLHEVDRAMRECPLSEAPDGRCEYYSTTHQSWILTKITATDAQTGALQIDKKPGVWLSPGEQKSRLRVTQTCVDRAAKDRQDNASVGKSSFSSKEAIQRRAVPGYVAPESIGELSEASSYNAQFPAVRSSGIVLDRPVGGIPPDVASTAYRGVTSGGSVASNHHPQQGSRHTDSGDCQANANTRPVPIVGESRNVELRTAAAELRTTASELQELAGRDGRRVPPPRRIIATETAEDGRRLLPQSRIIPSGQSHTYVEASAGSGYLMETAQPIDARGVEYSAGIVGSEASHSQITPTNRSSFMEFSYAAGPVPSTPTRASDARRDGELGAVDLASSSLHVASPFEMAKAADMSKTSAAPQPLDFLSTPSAVNAAWPPTAASVSATPTSVGGTPAGFTASVRGGIVSFPGRGEVKSAVSGADMSQPCGPPQAFEPPSPAGAPVASATRMPTTLDAMWAAAVASTASSQGSERPAGTTLPPQSNVGSVAGDTWSSQPSHGATELPRSVQTPTSRPAGGEVISEAHLQRGTAPAAPARSAVSATPAGSASAAPALSHSPRGAVGHSTASSNSAERSPQAVAAETVPMPEEATRLGPRAATQIGGACNTAPEDPGLSASPADSTSGGKAGGPLPGGDAICFDEYGRPTIVRQINPESGAARTIVLNPEGSHRVFGEHTVASLTNSSKAESKTWIDALTSHQLRGLVHEVGQRLLEGSRLYHARLNQLEKMGENLNYIYFGLTADASDKDLENAYRKLAKKLHPDKNGGTERAKERFQQMKERYEAIKKKRNEECEAESDDGDEGPPPESEEDDDGPMKLKDRRRKDKDDEDATAKEENAGDEASSIEYDPQDRTSMEKTVCKMLGQLKNVEIQMKVVVKELGRISGQLHVATATDAPSV